MASNLSPKESTSIDIDKFLLILGIVMVHSNVCIGLNLPGSTDVSESGRWIMDLFVGSCGAAYVPCFFILSGFLYFLNITDFSRETYKSKTLRRIRTLLIPYLLWNLIGMILQIIKCTFLNYPSYGIIDDGKLNLLKLLGGFWNIDAGYPYAVAFWFIRNLIIFSILSPICYSLSRSRIIFFAFILIICIFGVELYGFQYFVLGAFLAMHNRRFLTEGKISGILWGIVWVSLSATRLKMAHPPVFFNFIHSLAGFFAIFPIARGISPMSKYKSFRLLIGATFFIYALHQFFFSLTRNFYISLFGIGSLEGVAVSFIATCATLVLIPLGIWLILRKISPPIASLLTGNRLSAA